MESYFARLQFIVLIVGIFIFFQSAICNAGEDNKQKGFVIELKESLGDGKYALNVKFDMEKEIVLYSWRRGTIYPMLIADHLRPKFTSKTGGNFLIESVKVVFPKLELLIKSGASFFFSSNVFIFLFLRFLLVIT